VILILYHVAFIIAASIADYLIGLIVEREFGSHASLIAFLALYVLSSWLAWRFAVWMTKPKRAAQAVR
jgi:membrane protein implicated in regulation of membrane protease activity